MTAIETAERSSSEVAQARALALLDQHGIESSISETSRDALATRVMDLFRQTRSREAFEALVELTVDQLLSRVRARTRYLGAGVDPHELVQDAYINIYRYPDRFKASRAGAFRAWASTIVDNAVRRHLRGSRTQRHVQVRPIELLALEPDCQARQPETRAMDSEACERVGSAYRLFLWFYLAAFQSLSDRERFVLQMVEVEGMRYVELAGVLKTRPEALKMVVFRARRRIFERVNGMFPGGDAATPRVAKAS